MALIYNRRDEFSEQDLMDMVSKALRDNSSTPGESAYTKMLIERGEAVLANTPEPESESKPDSIELERPPGDV